MTKRGQWRTGKGYPKGDATVDEWEFEFIRRGENGLRGKPHFKVPNGSVEFFVGPSIVQINQDGSLATAPDPQCLNANAMVIKFQMDHDIDSQLARARGWLIANQHHYYQELNQRKRFAKYVTYLRVLDAIHDGAMLDEIAAVLHPALDNDYPKKAGAKLVDKAAKAAKKLAATGLRPSLIRK